jgi:hypothetical protein
VVAKEGGRGGGQGRGRWWPRTGEVVAKQLMTVDGFFVVWGGGAQHRSCCCQLMESRKAARVCRAGH